jgi:hypothetical protein
VQRAIALIFAAAFAFYSVAWRHAPVQDGDSPQYLDVAQDLADFRLEALHDRTPGYPLLLALTGSTPDPTRTLFYVSLVLHFASVWLLALVLHACGVPAMWLLAFCCVLALPPFAETAGYVMTENLAQFSLVAGFSSLMVWFRRGSVPALGAAALAFAFSALTRPAYQALAAALATLLLVPALVRATALDYGRAIRTGMALVAGSLLVLGTYAYFNHVKFGYFGLTPSLGFHLSTKTMSFVERLPDEYAEVREIFIRERNAQLVKRGGPHTGTQTIWSVRPELAAATGLSTAELSAYLLKMNLTLISRAPLEYLQEVARSLATYWFPFSGPLAGMNSSLLRWVWGLLHGALVMVLILEVAMLVALAALRLSERFARLQRRLVAPIAATATQTLAFALAGGIVFYTMILSCVIDIGEPRQRRTTDALFVFMCFLGIHVWRQTLERARLAEAMERPVTESMTPGPPASTR